MFNHYNAYIARKPYWPHANTYSPWFHGEFALHIIGKLMWNWYVYKQCGHNDTLCGRIHDGDQFDHFNCFIIGSRDFLFGRSSRGSDCMTKINGCNTQYVDLRLCCLILFTIGSIVQETSLRYDVFHRNRKTSLPAGTPWASPGIRRGGTFLCRKGPIN
jgi:hypothetical protein